MDIKYILPSLFLVTSSCVFSDILPRHGYINSPPSRAFLCSGSGNNVNKMCGPVQYEPQSVEGLKGFPETGPMDGKIASGGNANFDALNEQSPTRWSKTKVNSGKNTFSWTLTAAHRTTSWRFFITKQNWDPTTPLERSDFDLTPFCEQFDNGKMPASKVKINCNVPERQGYQVILGVWDIDDTANAFYQVIDANMTGHDNGSGNGNGNGNGNGSEDDDKKDKEYLTEANLVKDQKDNGSYVSYNLEVKSDAYPASTPDYKWSLPKNAEQVVTADNYSRFIINKKDNIQEDKVRVKVIAGKISKVLIQDINVPGLVQEHEYDYIFPDNLAFYTAGTIVYQPKDKNTYECKPFPNSGFCIQWSPGANQYEPGVGFAWQSAWTLLD
ncbi:lytic polysaccharide monooxygenase [Klebsiella sp. BIGb0407]|uniref:lytic polysaccharide monooxygenase n=1 Tax=Klebsiella sp. BIGb0407 TaxID=2940603 RepID=UPI002167C7DB|nr:lytic polysaccharide monooxygenase [Klebsiella sp. BIGb0407]MCS3431117.1 putative carbohydrate-binding protein with CBM5 and CBM33 domain [Klebsiella sp. BIGb0407]